MSPQSDRDAGFCSGGSEIGDDRSIDSPHSQIDVSEDSIEVKIPPVILSKNKRKSSEPVRVVETDLGPIKKRKRYDHFRQTTSEVDTALPMHSPPMPSISPVNLSQNAVTTKTEPVKPAVFRPWTVEGPSERRTTPTIPIRSSSPADVYVRHPGVTTLHRVQTPPQCETFDVGVQEEPLALIKKKPLSPSSPLLSPSTYATAQTSSSKPMIKVKSANSLRSNNSNGVSSSSSKAAQRNYKNMTRERRIEANARERSRVHTISAAYDTLRKCIPSYSSSQKLSKLAVLRIACAYILTLSRMNGEDLSADQSKPDIAECIERVSQILQAEGKIKKSDSDSE